MQNEPPATTLPLHIEADIQRHGVGVPRVQKPVWPITEWNFRPDYIDENGEPEF
jgi:hypothetical protein